MIGLTMCSGIGAPEVAAPWVDWRFGSEIEPFPREALRQRLGYRLPEDHNQGEPMLWGDMTQISPDLLKSRGIPLPDLVVAGTPCQAFSVAGARKGLADARGSLTLKFVEIVHAIVDARLDGKLAVLWENVPGVLSDKGNAFGCFLGGLVGAMDAIEAPAGGTWPSEGMVEGPRARLAWCVLDAQWFGVAQRRRRVFVVVDFGGAVDPAAVLLEPDSLRGNTPPSREAWKVGARGFECGPSGVGFVNIAPTLDAGCGNGPIRNQLGVGVSHFNEIKRGDINHPLPLRRLMPSECLKLQGFPHDHSRISWRGKCDSECPDSPQYKAIGNSMAVPCIRWILDRINISFSESRRK